MSFSSTVKNELCRLENLDKCCLLSELAATLCLNGIAAIIPDIGLNIRITTENAAFARRIYSNIKKLCEINPEVTIRKSKKLRKHASYILYITPSIGSEHLLNQLGLTVRTACGEKSTEEAGKIQTTKVSCGERPPEIVLSDSGRLKDVCCKKAFIRGAFLSGGSISDPEKTYHLEITTRTRRQALELSKMLGSFGLHARIIMRKGSFVTYLKEGENIVDFLNIIGAHKGLMELENVRILKDMRNNVNRIVNCETANLEKTVNASLRQVENIRYITKNIGLDKLPESLRNIAEMRIEFSDASLAELGQMLTPPIGKSGVNHRLRKIDRIAENHRRRTNLD